MHSRFGTGSMPGIAASTSDTCVFGSAPNSVAAPENSFDAVAWDMLRARLYEIELKRREAQAAADQAAKTDIGWGHQIRSYVLQPYQLVKDLRTGAQSTDPKTVLDGDIDDFIEAALAQRVKGGGPEKVEDID